MSRIPRFFPRNPSRVAAAVLIVSGLAILARAQVPPPAPAPPAGSRTALVGGTVHPISGPAIENGTVLFRDGILEAVGAHVAVPVGTRAIDVSGLHVYPGLFSANTILGLIEVGSIRQSNDFQEIGVLNPNAKVEVALNPESELIPVTRANGITTALVVPRGGLLSGTSALIHPDGWTWEQMTVKAPVALHVYWPSLSLNRSPNARPKLEEQRAAQEAQLSQIRDAFADARAYATAVGAARVPESGGKAARSPAVPRAAGDIRWEAMLPVIRGEIPVIVHADDARQITSALDWAREERVRMILAGGRDAPLLAGRLREQGVPVILGSPLGMPRRDYEPYDEAFTVPARLYEAGVTFCISTGGDASNERNLPYCAAMAWSYGLPHDEALRAVTLYPAQILGVGDRLGSLEAGKEATLIVTDGDPLDIRSHVVREYIAGRLIDLSSKHTRLYEKYRLRADTRPRPDGHE